LQRLTELARYFESFPRSNVHRVRSSGLMAEMDDIDGPTPAIAAAITACNHI